MNRRRLLGALGALAAGYALRSVPVVGQNRSVLVPPARPVVVPPLMETRRFGDLIKYTPDWMVGDAGGTVHTAGSSGEWCQSLSDSLEVARPLMTEQITDYQRLIEQAGGRLLPDTLRFTHVLPAAPSREDPLGQLGIIGWQADVRLPVGAKLDTGLSPYQGWTDEDFAWFEQQGIEV